MDGKGLSDSLLAKSLKENGTLAAIYLAVAFDVIVLINELFGEPQESAMWRVYAGAAGVGTLVFFIAILSIYWNENQTTKKFKFRILEEENHYEIENETECTVKIICKQKLFVKALHDNQTRFRLFLPLEEHTPSGFEFPNGFPKELGKKELEEGIDGVGVFYPNRKFIKGKVEEIAVTWEYENIPSEKGIMAAIIRRPTSSLKISVSIPTKNQAPKRTGWEMYNLERYSVNGGKAECTNYGNQYFITKSFKRAKEGFGYTLWWDY